MINSKIPVNAPMVFQQNPHFRDANSIYILKTIKTDPYLILHVQYQARQFILKTVSDTVTPHFIASFEHEIKCYQQFKSYDFCLPFQVILSDPDIQNLDYPILVLPYFEPILFNPQNLTANLQHFIQILHAVQQLHQLGYYHGDLKLSHCGYYCHQLKLIDFTYTQPLSAPQPYTKLHDGTPAYMSPQRFLGCAPHQADDIYALGIIFFQLLTGAKPFQPQQNSYRAWAESHCQHDIPLLPRSLEPFQPILDQLLAKQPQYRYRTVQQVHQDLAVIMPSYYGDKLSD